MSAKLEKLKLQLNPYFVYSNTTPKVWDEGFDASTAYHAEIIQELVNALEFYADEGSYNWHYQDKERTKVASEIDEDFGNLARQALESVRSKL